MPNTDEKEVSDIKAGVEGILSDVPEPSGEAISETMEQEIPETTYAEEGYPSPDYAGQTTQEYGAPAQGGNIDSERIHEIIEAVVDEKWDELMGKVGNIAAWKEKVNNDLVAIKQELVRVEENFRQLQNAILGRVKEYDSGIRDVHTEMKALEKVFEKILDPLTTNIKELGKITEEMKRVKR